MGKKTYYSITKTGYWFRSGPNFYYKVTGLWEKKTKDKRGRHKKTVYKSGELNKQGWDNLFRFEETKTRLIIVPAIKHRYKKCLARGGIPPTHILLVAEERPELRHYKVDDKDRQGEVERIMRILDELPEEETP